MILLCKIAIVEAVRTLSLAAAAASAILFTSLTLVLAGTLYHLFLGRIPFENWQLLQINMVLAFAPAVFVACAPSFAAGRFDVRYGTRQLSPRETEHIAKVEEQLQDRADKSGIKLPKIVWRVEDTGGIYAYAYAHNRVCFTTGILQKLGDTQAGIEHLTAIAAHEIGHLRNWDTRFNFFLHYLTLPVNFGIGLANATINRIPIIGLFSTAAVIFFRMPCNIAHSLNEVISPLKEYRAEAFAARLVNGTGPSMFLEEPQGGTIT